MLTDAELLRRYAEEKSEAAFTELVRRYVDLVYSAALRQLGGDAHRAEDVAQIVFTTLARKARLLTRHPVLAGWLYTATQHAAAKAIRSEVRRHAREQEAHAMQLPPENPTPAAPDWGRIRPVLDDAMRELGEHDREAVLLRFFARRPFAEIGAALNLSEDAARMRVARALDKLHALLAKRGITSTSAALGVALTNEVAIAAPAGLAASVSSAALTGAAAAGVGSLAAALYLMSASKVTLSIAAAGALAVGFAVHQSGQASAAAMEVERARDGYAAVRARVATLAAELKTAEQQKPEREAALARIAAEKAAAVTAARARQMAEEDRKKQAAALQQFLGSDPELLKLRHEAAAAEYRSNFAWRAQVMGGKDAVEEGARKSADLAERNDVRKQAGLEAEVATGGPGPRNPDARRNSFAFASYQYHLDEPYSREQAARLESVLVDAQVSREPNLDQYSKFDWDKVVTGASSFLSPSQLEVLRAFQAWGRGARLRREVEASLRAATPATQ